MSCCSPTIIPFFNEAVTTVNYGPAYVLQYGPAPTVDVLYWDGTQYVSAGITTEVKFDTVPVTLITVAHGGPATGLIKIR